MMPQLNELSSQSEKPTFSNSPEKGSEAQGVDSTKPSYEGICENQGEKDGQ